MPDYEKQEWLFMRRPVQKLVQKPHWARGVGERDQSGLVDRRDQKTGRDPDGLGRVVVLEFSPVR